MGGIGGSTRLHAGGELAWRPAPFTQARRRRSCAAEASSSKGARSLAPLPDAAAAPGLWQRLQGGAAAALVAAAVALASPPPSAAVTNEQLLYLEAWRAVDRAYVDKKFNGQNWFKVREDALKKPSMKSRGDTYAAIRSMLSSLDDPFTRFLEPEQYTALRRSTSGAVTGVGVEVSFSAAKGAASDLVVISPAPGGPADRAGIKPRDEILAIDGRATRELSLYAAGGLLQGAEGSEVVLTVKPHAGGAARDVALTRAPITINPVDSQLCSSSGRAAPGAPDAKLGFIRVATFSKQTAERVRAALGELRAAGAERLVLDVRNNGGGLFPAGVEVGRMLIPRGDIVLIADSSGVRDIYEADGTAIDPATPLAVLANRGTASASEVLAGALKDSGRGRVVGENTFGKGLIQTLVELSDGSAVAVTVARYQTPSGTDINKIGITPDVALSPKQLADLPLNGEAFCKYLAGEAAPQLFP